LTMASIQLTVRCSSSGGWIEWSIPCHLIRPVGPPPRQPVQLRRLK
jgi:hypothetical protein